MTVFLFQEPETNAPKRDIAVCNVSDNTSVGFMHLANIVLQTHVYIDVQEILS